MRKTAMVLALAAAGALAASPAFAQSHDFSRNQNLDKGGWFVNGSVGRTSVNNGPYDDHDTGYGITGGYRWAVTPRVALGVEAGYNDLGNIKASNVFHGDDVYDSSQSSLHGWTAGVNGHFNVTPNWYVSARTGMYGWSGHGLSNNKNPLNTDVDNTDWYGGVGVGYDFNRHISLGVDYDYYHAKEHNVDLTTDMVSANVEYRF